jgi:hypothetical protein
MNRITLPLLALCMSLAPVLCGAAEPNADHAKAIAEIKKLGGKVTVDEKSPGKPVISVDLTQTKVTDAGLVYVEALTRLQSLDVSWAEVTDAGLVHLRELNKLQLLDLFGTKVTDAGIRQLKGFAKLQSLGLCATEVTDAGLEQLKSLTELQMLSLMGTTVTAAGVKELQKALPKCTIFVPSPSAETPKPDR